MTADPQPSSSRLPRLAQLRKKLSEGLSRRWHYGKRFAASCKRPARILFFITAVVVLLHIVFSMAPDTATLIAWVRRTGLILQIGGLVAVIWGMRKSLQLFGKPLPEVRVLQWLTGLWHVAMPPEPQHHVIEVGTAEMRMEVHPVRVTVSGGSVEQRLKNIESDVNAAWDRIERVETRVAVNERAARDGLAKEVKERQDADKELQRNLESALIGDSHLEASGVAFVFVGIVLATVPEELVTMFQQLGLYNS